MEKEKSDPKIMAAMEKKELQDRYIRFDWAIKRLLRQKANFDVLDGFLTVMLNEEIKIVEILESEGNQERIDDKFNRVDIKALNSKGEIIIVEIQNTREIDYLERILYGVAKAITEHISLGDNYGKIRKVYSISILYFNIGIGTDYIYHGQNHFVGVHTGDYLRVNTRERNALVSRLPTEIFPEYILIRVNEFDKVALTPLDEWIAYLKDGTIRPDTTVPGLREAREKLKFYTMSPNERAVYIRHIEDLNIQEEAICTTRLEGFLEGKEEGIAEGMEKGMRQIATNMKHQGVKIATIVKYTGLSEETIRSL